MEIRWNFVRVVCGSSHAFYSGSLLSLRFHSIFLPLILVITASILSSLMSDTDLL